MHTWLRYRRDGQTDGQTDRQTAFQLYIVDKQTTDGMTWKFFPETILLLKVDCFEGFLNQCKLTEW